MATGRFWALLVEDPTIRCAVHADVDFLTRNGDTSAAVIRRKIELEEFIVAVLKGELAGFLQLEYLWAKVPYIALIRVLPDYRRSGIGKGMLEFAEDFLREKNYRSLYSSSQADELEPHAWHRHVGFRECGIIRGINDGIDEVFFCKSLVDK